MSGNSGNSDSWFDNVNAELKKAGFEKVAEVEIEVSADGKNSSVTVKRTNDK